MPKFHFHLSSTFLLMDNVIKTGIHSLKYQVEAALVLELSLLVLSQVYLNWDCEGNKDLMTSTLGPSQWN